MHELVDQLLSHLKAIWRYRWYAMAIAWVIALGGWVAVYQIQDRYSVSARVAIDDQSMLKPLMAGITVRQDLDDVTRSVIRYLLGRPNLEKVIRIADPDFDLKTAEEQGNLMNRLAQNVSILRAREGGRDRRRAGESIYGISFIDEDPQLAHRVVQTLLDMFVERSLSDNREDADSARRFIDEQLAEYRKRLVASENEIIAFKRKNVEFLPGAGPDYFEQLVETKEAVRQAELALREAENAVDSIKEQLANASRNASQSEDVATVPETEIDVRISVLEQKLDDLRLRFTEQHPDIVGTVDIIAKLKERKAADEAAARQLKERKDAEARLRGDTPIPMQATDPVYQQLTVSLSAAEASAAAMRARTVEQKRRYAELQAAANAVPQVEAEFTQLTRDYEVNKTHYSDLLRRREKAQISQDMETGTAELGIRVIAAARFPGAPSEPDRLMLMTLVLLAGLAGGLGIAWLISQMRPTINDERKLREVSGLPVLGTVIMDWTEAKLRRRKWGTVAFLASFASLFSAYGVIMALMLTGSRA